MTSAIHTVRATPSHRPRGLARLLIAVLPVAIAAVVGGLATTPTSPTWYDHLVKPSFTPPNWVFGPAWTILFAMMAYALWRILGRASMTHGRTAAIVAFFVQLVLNSLWSFAFFAARSPFLGLVDLVPFWLAVCATMILFWRIDRVSGALFVPYLGWVSFAAALNIGVWMLNR